MIRILILFLLTGCAGLPIQSQIPQSSGSILGGAGSVLAYQKVKKALPKYEKVLSLPAVEICYIDENQDIICTINTCKEKEGVVCDKNYGHFVSFVSFHVEETYFIKKTSVLNLLSHIETFCKFHTDQNLCQIIVDDYSSIKKVLIYEED